MQINETVRGKQQDYKLLNEWLSQPSSMTYLGLGQKDGRYYAIKVMDISQLQNWISLDYFENEIKILQNLSHPAILPYIEHFIPGDTKDQKIILVLEYNEGNTLREHILRKKSLSEKEIYKWLYQILQGLAYLHHLHPPVVHQNITPDNIFLGNDGNAYLLNFENAAISLSRSLDFDAINFSDYSPPEQHSGLVLPACDLYSLAMTCLVSISHVDPQNFPYKHDRIQVRSLIKMDERFTGLLENLLEPELDKRLTDAAIALKTLEPLLFEDFHTDSSAAALNKRKEDNTAMWALPFQNIDLDGITRFAVSQNGKVMSLENFVIDLNNLSVIDIVKPDDICNNLFIETINAAGDIIAATTNLGIPISIYRLTPQGYRKTLDITDEKLTRLDKLVISPDGSLLLVIDNGKILLYDVKTGVRIQDIYVEDSGTTPYLLLFNHDGSAIVYTVDKITHILELNGTKSKIDQTHGVFFSNDGKFAAILREKQIDFKNTENLLDKRVISSTPFDYIYSISRGSFSPDSRFFLFFERDRGELFLIDVRSGKIINTFRDPIDEEKEMDLISLPAFSSDSKRFIIFCDNNFNKYSTEHESNIQFYRTADGIFLGSIIIRETEEPSPGFEYPHQPKQALIVSSTGFYTPLTQKKIVAEKKPSLLKKIFGKKEEKPAVIDPWEKEIISKNSISGYPIEVQLDEDDRIRISEIETRYEFFANLVKNKRLAKEADLLNLIEKSHGLTGRLDMVAAGAQKMIDEKKTFGMKNEKVPFTEDMLLNSIQKIKANNTSAAIL